MAFLPAPTHQDFWAASNLAAALNSTVVFINDGWFSSIGFTLTIPTGGTVVFEESKDQGTTWVLCTLRTVGISPRQYTQQSTVSGNFVGSISTSTRFRVRVSVAWGAAWTVIGRAQRDASTLEGIENANAPHSFGEQPVHKDLSRAVAQTNAAVWTPTAGERFVVTDIIISQDGASTVTLFDNTNAAWNIVAAWRTAANFNWVIALRTPYVSAAVNNVLRITTTWVFSGSIVVHGYEIL